MHFYDDDVHGTTWGGVAEGLYKAISILRLHFFGGDQEQIC